MRASNLLLGSVLSAWLCWSVPAAAQDETAQLQTLMEKIPPAIVSIKALVKTESKFGGQSRDTESRVELQGVVVDPDGLIMVPNTLFAPARFMSIMGSEMPEGSGMKATPTEFKVQFEQEEKEYSAFLAATDTKLDLAFIKVEDLNGRKLNFVEFKTDATATTGQKVVSISRMSKGFDYAPYFTTARIAGAIAKPRRAWMLDGGMSDFGLPVFTINGEAIGVLSTIEGGIKGDTSREMLSFTFSMRMVGGGSGGAFLRSFIIPSSAINAVIAQAKQRAVTVAEERAKKKTATPPKAPDKNAKPPKKS